MRTPRIRLVSIAVLTASICMTTMVVPMLAHAMNVAANYRMGPLTYATGTAIQSCRGWSADADDAGRFYSGCPVLRDTNGDGIGDVGTPALFEYDTAGRVTRIGYLPAEYYFSNTYRMRDVAVSPDGNTAYISVGPIFDNLGQRPEINPDTMQPLPNGAVRGTILRMKRQGDGSWAYDPSFKAGPFKLGAEYWAARYLDVDASGRIYVGANAYVFELSPVTGQIVSFFGGGAATTYPGGPWVEGIDVVEGITASADGNTLYVVEEKFHIVQRWTRVGATGWQRDPTFLLGRPSEEDDDAGSKGYCTTDVYTNQRFQAPYDVAIDAAGDIYVMDVSCNRIQRFNKAGTYIQTVWSDLGGDDLLHGFAVNWQGSIIAPEIERVLVRLDPAVRPVTGGGPAPTCTDKTAPKLTAVTLPASSRSRSVRIEAKATDDCGITETRVTGAVSGSKAWKAGTAVTVPISGWNGTKQLVVQVRDKAGRIATRRVKTRLALPQPTLVARTRVSLAGSGCSAGNPMARVGNASTYRLADRCATLRGTAHGVKRSGSGWMFQVTVPVGTARAIYSNAVGPVSIWVVSDGKTKANRAPRNGRSVTVVGSIVALRSLRAAYAIPVDTLTAR